MSKYSNSNLNLEGFIGGVSNLFSLEKPMIISNLA